MLTFGDGTWDYLKSITPCQKNLIRLSGQTGQKADSVIYPIFQPDYFPAKCDVPLFCIPVRTAVIRMKAYRSPGIFSCGG